MMNIYVYPVDGFDRNIAVKSLIKVYLRGKDVERYSLEEFIEALNDDVINLNNNWVRAIDDNEGYYPISSLHVDDLAKSGFDASKITEDDMMTLADKLSDDYCDQLFWNSLEIIADAIGIPRIEEANKSNLSHDKVNSKNNKS